MIKLKKWVENHRSRIGRHIFNLRCVQDSRPDPGFATPVSVTPSERIDTKWLYYMLVDLNLNQYATGQAQPGLSVKNLESVGVRVPNTLEEQQKIASVLNSADQEIEILQTKLSHLKQEKKALMQQLLTGKRRVTVESKETA
ncbi:restriction endonuclease subunit S [Endozoicomonas acroporae]|uniref:restriction endonuclease subunit S n=1 Tax=Endozoicomonas acroporae TaxID=1701104 RepID=UPI003D7AA8CB